MTPEAPPRQLLAVAVPVGGVHVGKKLLGGVARIEQLRYLLAAGVVDAPDVLVELLAAAATLARDWLPAELVLEQSRLMSSLVTSSTSVTFAPNRA